MKPSTESRNGQGTLFGEGAEQRFEVHEHAFLRRQGHVVHSHDGGDRPHQHRDTGPADYSGARKLTRTPTGEQFPSVELEPWQTQFEVIFYDPPAEHRGHGPGELPIARMVNAFRMTPRLIDRRRNKA